MKEEAKNNFTSINNNNSSNLERLISENNKKVQSDNLDPDEKLKILINKDGVKEYGTEQDEGQEEE